MILGALLLLLVVLAAVLAVDYAVTAANVKPGTGGQRQTGIAGETLTAGQPVYKDTVSGSATLNQYLLSDSNVAAKARVDGLTLGAAGPGQAFAFQTATTGEFILGGGLVAGDIVVLSANPGKLAPSADLAATWHVIIVGVALDANRIKLLGWDSTAVK